MIRYSFILSAFGMQAMVTNRMPKVAVVDPVRLSGDTPPMSLLNTPIFDNVIIYDEATNTELRIDAVLMDVRQEKIIIYTKVQGRDGTVKEFISNDDYQIDMRGMITSSDPKLYPTEDVNKLISLCKLNNSLKIASDYLNLFGITDIVIDNIEWLQRKGFQGNQLFYIRAVSDKPVELTIDEEAEL